MLGCIHKFDLKIERNELIMKKKKIYGQTEYHRIFARNQKIDPKIHGITKIKFLNNKLVTLIKEAAEITDTKTELEITKGITLLSLEASSSEKKKSKIH